MLEVAAHLPWCTVALAEPLGSPRGRLFAGYRVRGGFRRLLGQGVLDEFGTLSSPILLAPAELLGRIYDFGIAFGFRYDAELPLDGGWPPICIGLERPAPELPADWESELAAVIAGPPPAAGAAAGYRLERLRVGSRRLDRLRLGEAVVLATDAPLLPQQLGRLCEAAGGAVALAVACGQRLTRSGDGRPAAIAVAAESELAELAAALAGGTT